MRLVSFRQGFDPLHTIERPESKTVQVNIVSSLDLPKEAEKPLYDGLMTANWLVYNTEISATAIWSLVASNPLCGKHHLDQIDRWLGANTFRWIALLND